jgi:UDP-GlcNAc:undecaprenyl-phosphate GlcNAc-1-phosphate transferase
MLYFIAMAISFVLSLAAVFVVRRIALRYNIVDRPEVNPDRKIHQDAMPFMGAVAIFFAFSVTLLGFTFLTNHILGHTLELKNILGVILAGLVVTIGGILDDKYDLPAKYQILFPAIAVIIIILSGIGIEFITNPFGGMIDFSRFKFKLLTLGGVPYFINLISDGFTFIWLMVVVYMLKIFDGLDGLVSGLSVIGGLIVAGLCLFTAFYQPEVALIALIFSGACLGVWTLNFYPAKIFLGEASVFCGLMLGILAIISGSKIATALLVLAVPLFDLVWVVIRRTFVEHKPFWRADRKHIHFRLLDLGVSHRNVVLIFYAIAFAFGLVTLVADSLIKLIVLIILALLLTGSAWYIAVRQKRIEG